MATFSSLPNELISHIIELAEPDDLEKLSAVCKRIRNLASKTVQQHRGDKRSFSIIALSLFTTFKTQSALQVALKIYDVVRGLAGDQRLRLYPKHVFMDSDAYAIGEWKPRGSAGLKAKMEEDGTYRARVFDTFENPYIGPDEMETWRARVAEGDLQAANCLLLTLLPNVETIDVNDWLSNSMMADMIERIAKRNACAPRIPGTMLSLSKLSEISISGQNHLRRTSMSNKITQALLSIPSVRVLRGAYLRADFPIPHTTNLAELHLRRCAVAATDLSQLFAHLKCVKKFVYNHDSAWENRSGGRDYSCDTFIATLARHAGNTLQELEYSTYGESAIQHSDNPEFTSGLKRFNVLERICITCAFFVSDHNPETRVVQRLVELLPPSVKILTLIGCITLGDSLGSRGGLENGEEAMFAGVAELKDERFPHLEEVIFQNSDWKRVMDESPELEVFDGYGYYILVNEETKSACEKVGIAMRAELCSRPPARKITEEAPRRNAAETQTIAAS